MTNKAKKFREALPELADLWLMTYEKAISEGLSDRPSGPLVDDLECHAAASLTGGFRSGFSRGRWPAIYGGNVDIRSEVNRWSAPRRAALAVFERALKLELDPAEAGRAVRAAKTFATHLVRVRYNLPRFDKFSLSGWLKLTEAERRRRSQTKIT